MPCGVDVGRVGEDVVASKQSTSQKGGHGVQAVHLSKLGILTGLHSELGLHQARVNSCDQQRLEGDHQS